MVNVRKRGKGYQYYFEIAPVNGKRKQQVKSGFKTKKAAKQATKQADITSAVFQENVDTRRILS